MTRTKIVVDSASDLSQEMIDQMQVPVQRVPLTIRVDGQPYVDDEELDVEQTLRRMEASPGWGQTAAPAPEAFLQAYGDADEVFAVTLSSKLSNGTYNAAMAAKQMLDEAITGVKVHVFDSLSASVGEALLALKIAELARLRLPFQEIVDSMNQFIKQTKTYILLERYDVLAKTGRMNPAIAKLASFLNIKPICQEVEGTIALMEKVRGYGKAMARLVDIIAGEKIDWTSRLLAVSHIKCLDRALTLRDELVKRLPDIRVLITEASGIIALYGCRGGLVVSF